MGRQERWDRAKSGSARQGEIRQAVKDLGESTKGNQAQRMKRLVELTGSEERAKKAYDDYTGSSGALGRLLGRRR